MDPNATASAMPSRLAEQIGRPVLVVDDHRFMREMITARLGQDPRYVVVAAVGDVKTAIEACGRLSPDLAILDIHLPDGSGIDAVAAINQCSPTTRILLCTAMVSDDCIVDALRSGAQGFVEKTNSWEDFLQAIECVCAGERYFRSHCSPSFSGAASTAADGTRFVASAALSAREIEVLTMVAQEDSTKEIAAKLFLSIGTVERHRTNLMLKLKTRNLAGLVVYAFRAGLIR
jgi:DNA-binding NarL/FixJ family response regulator